MSASPVSIESLLDDYFALDHIFGPRANRLTLHPAQAQIKREASRFNVLACGRRFGKSRMDADLLVEVAEQGYPAGYFAPTYKFLLEGWRDIKDLVGEELIARSNESEHRIELKTGGVIEAWSLDGDTGTSATGKKSYKSGRSRKYKRVAIDEAALINDLQNVFDYAIAPTLIDYQGDAWFTSTPNGKGAFYRMYLKGQPGGDPEWMSWQMPTSVNPHLPPGVMETAKRRYPDAVYRQEYLAEFLEDGGAVFRNITACTVAQAKIWRDLAEPYHVYVIGWDLAKKDDFSVMTVIDCTTKTIVNIERFNNVEYMLQIPRVVALCEAFQPRELVVESNGNLALLEVLRTTKYSKEGPLPQYINNTEGFTDEEIRLANATAHRLWSSSHNMSGKNRFPTFLPVTEFVALNKSKEEAIQALVLAFERKEITIPDHAALLAELEVFGMERLPGGSFRYSAPAGEHDDCVMSLAEGWYRARRYMSVEELPSRIRAIRRLSPELRPENISNNPNPMAHVSQQYHVTAYEKELKKAGRHFMKKFR